MDIKQELLDALLENINIEGLAFTLIDEVLEEGLNEVVAKADNPLTTMLMSAIYPPLELALKNAISKKITGLKLVE